MAGRGASRATSARDMRAAGLPALETPGTPGLWRTGSDRYFAYSTARVSRITVTLIWPG
jgi:hypothetical protein